MLDMPQLFLLLHAPRSKSESEAHRTVLLEITCGRSAIADECGVGVVETGGDIARIAVLDNVGIS
jgi:hypothetical protein